MIFGTQNDALYFLGVVTFGKFFPNSYSSVLMFIFLYFCVIKGSQFHFQQLVKSSSHFLFLSLLKSIILWPSLYFCYKIAISRQFDNNYEMQTIYFPDVQYIYSQLFGDMKVTLFYVIVCTCIGLITFINQTFASLQNESENPILKLLSQFIWAFLCFYFTLTSYPFDILILIRTMWFLSLPSLVFEIYVSLLFSNSSTAIVTPPQLFHSFEAEVSHSLRFTLVESSYFLQHWSHLIQFCGSALFMPHYLLATLYYLDANITVLFVATLFSILIQNYYHQLDLFGKWLQWCCAIIASAICLQKDYFFVVFNKEENLLDTILNPMLQKAYLQFFSILVVGFVVVLLWRRNRLQRELVEEIKREELYNPITLPLLQGIVWLVYLALLRPIANIFFFKKVLDVQLIFVQPLSLFLFSLVGNSSNTAQSLSKKTN